MVIRDELYERLRHAVFLALADAQERLIHAVNGSLEQAVLEDDVHSWQSAMDELDKAAAPHIKYQVEGGTIN